MKDTAKYPNLDKRNGVYRYRQCIPVSVTTAIKANLQDWQSIVAAKGETCSKWKAVIRKDGQPAETVAKSLKTKDQREAMKRYHIVAGEYEQIYASIISTLDGKKIVPTEWDAQRFAQNYFQSKDQANAYSFIQPIENREEVKQVIFDDLAHATNIHPQADYEYTETAEKILTK